jgi:hypothetical protein
MPTEPRLEYSAIPYETGFQKLTELAESYRSNHSRRNEATTRHHVIDVLIHDCLGWPREDVLTEESYDGNYTDYTFMIPRRAAIWEAKKEGTYFEIPAGTRSEIPVATLIRNNDALKDAVHQVTRYCQARGVALACVTNGHQIIVFAASRDDGKPPLEGTAAVFSSVDDMQARFLTLWQILSKDGLIEQNYRRLLLAEARAPLPPKLSESIDNYPGAKARSELQTELQILSDLVIEDISRHRDIEERFLRECYCESGALSQYSLLSKDILSARYAALQRTPGLSVNVSPMYRGGINAQMLAESLSGRPTILLGDRGVGKSMFIRNFIKVAAADVVANSLSFYVDLGSNAALTSDVRLFVVEDIIRQPRDNYNINVYERDFVRSVYHDDLGRLKGGILGDLLKIDTRAFAEREINFLADKIAQTDQFLKDSLRELARKRNRQIIVFVDNADQRDPSTQQSAFLIANELATNGIAATFVALRPETFYDSVREGTLSGYHARVFTISPPRIDRVLTQRLQFALTIANGEIETAATNSALRFSSRNLAAILKVMLDSLRANVALVECIDNISAGDVRLSLDLIKEFMGSAHIRTRRILELFQESGTYTIPVHEFIRGIIYGDAEYYDPDRSPVANLFDISSPDRWEHFILPLLLGYLANFKENNHTEGFVKAERIYDALQSMGFIPTQIDTAIARGCQFKLIESGSRYIAATSASSPRVLRITQDGVYHFQKMVLQFEYFDAVIVDVPILDAEKRRQITVVTDFWDRLSRVEAFCEYLDECWKRNNNDGHSLFNWPSVATRLRAHVQRLKRPTRAEA